MMRRLLIGGEMVALLIVCLATAGLWIRSHVHWEDLDLEGAERILIPTFRLPTLVHTRSGNSKWLNEISDSGVGISNELMEHIFTPFFSTRPLGIGTGLGLPICRRLVEDIGGELRVTSREGKGSTFSILLPIADQLDVQPKVVVLTCEQLAQVVADNPFPGEDNPRQVHALFWNGPLGPEELAAIDAAQRQPREAGGRDEARVVGTTLYLHTPDGYGRSELAARLARIGGGRSAATVATARNWATVRRLLDMCDS